MNQATITASLALGITQRQMQRLAGRGLVSSELIAGRRVVSERAVLAISRARGRGRRWNEATVAAALELLEFGETSRLDGRQRQRLNERLRATGAGGLAYQMLADRISLWRGAQRHSQADSGMTSIGSTVSVEVVKDARRQAQSSRLIEDLNGDILMLELDTDATEAAEAIVLYAYGDERTSSAARRRIEAMIARLA